jgi:hypothetical protein|tara:strand:+ start:1239 stop:1571 length:333 start_codon:yes stop_codon:yes gene_type:complete
MAELDNSNLNLNLFLEVISSLQAIEQRRVYLAENVGIDITGLEDVYFQVIENLLNLTFNKNQLTLLHKYLYELSTDNEWDGYVQLKVGETKKKVLIKTPRQLWDTLQLIK